VAFLFSEKMHVFVCNDVWLGSVWPYASYNEYENPRYQLKDTTRTVDRIAVFPASDAPTNMMLFAWDSDLRRKR
jgi:hypothetical protein